MELNAAWCAAPVLVDVQVIKLGASDSSEVGVVVFNPSIMEYVVEELIFSPYTCFLMSSASDYLRSLL